MAFFYKYEFTNKRKNIHPCEEEDVAGGNEEVKKEGCTTLAGKVKADEVVLRDGVTVKNELLEVESLGNRGANLAGETQE